MPRGKSGRIVLEIDPKLKRQLYLSLEKNQKTLKEWFIENASVYITEENVAQLILAESKSDYKVNNKK